ncbi:MAG: hypothetical protein LCH93_07015 [Proteobacteria bacterium]|nr:hypothetical protein [Pseudomonadota bacterium]
MADVEIALSESTVQQVFRVLRGKLREQASGSVDLVHFSIDWTVGIRLEKGRIDFQSNNTVLLKELDIVYDPLVVTPGLNIPKVCVGGNCILPSPFGCIIRLPRYCFFEADPDLKVPLDLSGLIRSEISGTCGIRTEHFDDPGNAGMSVWQAHAQGVPDKWRFFLNPGWLDIDLIDIADTVGALLDKLIAAVVDTILGWLPDWAQDLVEAILGSFADLIRDILDIGDDIEEWLSNLLGISIGLFDLAVQLVLQHFAKKTPIFELENPYPIMPAEAMSGGPVLVPVLVPVVDPKVVVTDPELTISASIGV